MRINLNDINKYAGKESSSGFFSLKNDRDTAVVYFLDGSIDDLDVLVVHKVPVNGKDRYVSCIRKAGEPSSSCPLCASGNKPSIRIFAQVLDTRDNAVKIWDRGQAFVDSIRPIARRVNPLYKRPIEIERHGAAGYTKTNYSLYPLEADDQYPELTPDKLPEKTPISGPDKSFVLEKTYEELEAYVNNGSFEAPIQIQRRQPSSDSYQDTQGSQPQAQQTSRYSTRRVY